MKKLFNAVVAGIAKACRKPLFVQQAQEAEGNASYSIVTGPFCRTIVIPMPKKNQP